MQQLGFALPDRSNAILVDSLEVSALIRRLTDNYDQKNIHDLYELLVQIVLRDRLWLLPSGPDRNSAELMKPWLDNGAALWFPRVRNAPTHNAQREAARRALRGASEPVRRMSRFVGTANLHGLPCFVTTEQNKCFAAIAAPTIENAYCDLLGHHRYIDQRIRGGMLRRGVCNPQLVNLRIPPLPFEIIRRSSSLEDVIWNALDVRHEYGKTRRDHAEVSAILADPTVSPRTKLREIASLEESWRAIHKLADGAIDVPHAKSGGYMSQLLVSGMQLGFGLGAFDPGSILGGTLGVGHSAVHLAAPLMRANRAVWRLQPFGNSVRHCWETSDRQMMGHLQRILGPQSSRRASG